MPEGEIGDYLVRLGLQDTSFKAPSPNDRANAAVLRYAVSVPLYGITDVTP